jgi:hypothetical protein
MPAKFERAHTDAKPKKDQKKAGKCRMKPEVLAAQRLRASRRRIWSENEKLAANKTRGLGGGVECGAS